MKFVDCNGKVHGTPWSAIIINTVSPVVNMIFPKKKQSEISLEIDTSDGWDNDIADEFEDDEEDVKEWTCKCGTTSSDKKKGSHCSICGTDTEYPKQD